MEILRYVNRAEVLAAIVSCCIMADARAQCSTLQYTGTPFATVVLTGIDPQQPVDSPVVGLITLSGPLAGNLSNATVVPVSWDFSPESGGFASYPPSVTVCGTGNWVSPCGTFVFSTDANGAITDWNVTLGEYGTEANFSITLTNTGDTVRSWYSGAYSGTGAVTLLGTSTTAGTWSCPVGYTTNYTAPPDPPAANPLAAQVASQAAELHSLQDYYLAVLAAYKAEIADLTAEVERLK